MNPREKRRWGTLAAVWAGALSLVVFNHLASDEVAVARVVEEKASLEAGFLVRVGRGMREASSARAALIDAVPSAELGTLAVSERMRAEAKAAGIPLVAITAQGAGTDHSQELVAVFSGSFAQLNAWLDALASAAPFVVARSVKAAAEPARGVVRFDVAFDYSFQIREPEAAGATEVAAAAGEAR